jgi:DNA-binding transcriptional regulator YiaG
MTRHTSSRQSQPVIWEQRDAAPNKALTLDVRAILQATGMTKAQFAVAYEFSVLTIEESERGAKRPSGRLGYC